MLLESIWIGTNIGLEMLKSTHRIYRLAKTLRKYWKGKMLCMPASMIVYTSTCVGRRENVCCALCIIICDEGWKGPLYINKIQDLYVFVPMYIG